MHTTNIVLDTTGNEFDILFPSLEVDEDKFRSSKSSVHVIMLLLLTMINGLKKLANYHVK